MLRFRRFRRMRSLQKFAAVHASIYNLLNSERSLQSRPNFKLNEPPRCSC
jgi:putative transposase